MTLRVFPVYGGARYASDYREVAIEGARRHLGNDLFAPVGTPLLAVDDGVVRFGTDPFGGNVAILRTPDGSLYYYAHLSSYNGSNRSVRAGEVIGYLGTSGNAEGTDPHVHFEVRRGAPGMIPGGAFGGVPSVDPFPLLAEARVLYPTRTSAPAISSRLLPIALGGGLLGLGYWLWTNRRPARPARSFA